MKLYPSKPTNPRFNDLEGMQFWRLTVVAYAGKLGTHPAWHCKCVCGAETIARTNDLKRGDCKSCGCLSRERSAKRHTTHGKAGTPTHRVWEAMRRRCNNKNQDNYERYGGRGIRVCDRWNDSFEAFLEDMGERPSDKHTIDRIDSDGDYEPSNCRWATIAEQNRNTRRTRMLTFQGKTMCLTDWAKEVGMHRDCLNTRIQRGWSVERALTTPVRIQ